MVDVGLYAITPFQFRLAHDIGLENFLSPSEEQPDGVLGDDKNCNSSKGSNCDTNHRRTQSDTIRSPVHTQAKNGFKNNDIRDIDSGIFTLTLEKRPEKRERSRSGSDAISPEPKRVIGQIDSDVISIEESRVESDNGNISPSTASSDGSSVFQTKSSSDTDDTIGNAPVPTCTADVITIVSPEAGCSHDNGTRGSHSWEGRQSPDDTHTQDVYPDRPAVVRRKRRPRKLPQIPPNAQRKSVATLMQGQSIADELTGADPSPSRSQRALKAMSWIEMTARTSSTSSQDSGCHGYQSLDELGSPEAVDSSHLELVEKLILQKDLLESKQFLNKSVTLESLSGACGADGTEGNGMAATVAVSPSANEVAPSLMTASMSMSLMEELESEGVSINTDLGSTFCDVSEYIDDEMPKLKRFFGEDSRPGSSRTPPNPTPPSSIRVRTGSNNVFLAEASSPEDNRRRRSSRGQGRRRHVSTASGPSRHASSSGESYSGDLEALDATHRGCHKFIPRHEGEVFIEIGDLLSVDTEAEDLWCEGVNLTTGKRGIFPAAYATDLSLLDGDGTRRFKLRFLGSVEVNQHKGNEVICTAIQKVVMSRRVALEAESPPLYCVQINEYGIKMVDMAKKSKKGPQIRSSIRERLAKILNKEYKEEKDTDHFFTLKNVSFCGFHPRNERYFAFVTKHPHEHRFACHVFQSERSTVPICEAVGAAFRRFYEEYMAFAHPTEDIYLE